MPIDKERIAAKKDQREEGNTMQTLDISKIKQSKLIKSKSSIKEKLCHDAVTLELNCDVDSENQVTDFISGYMFIGPEVLEELGKPQKVQIGICDEVILIGENLPVDSITFDLKKRSSGGFKQIQRKDFIREIFEFYGFEIGNRRISFKDISYQSYEGATIAVVKALEQEEPLES